MTLQVQYIVNPAEKGFAERAHIAEHHHIKSGGQVILQKIGGQVRNSFLKLILRGNLSTSLASVFNVHYYRGQIVLFAEKSK